MTEHELRIVALERQLATARELFIGAKTEKAPKTKVVDARRNAETEFDDAVRRAADPVRAIPSAMEGLVDEASTVVNLLFEVRQGLMVINMPMNSPILHEIGQKLISAEDRLFKATQRVALGRRR